MKYLLTFLTLMSVYLPVSLAQSTSVYQQVYDTYEQYREPAITTRRFKHADLMPLLEKLESKSGFNVQPLGQSIQGRSINCVRFGHGPVTVLMWSQMHGDESTATMAGLDLFNFFSRGDELDDLRKTILDAVTIYFIPMLNPDGAEVFQRWNALGMDLNRDALRLQSPESRILKNMRDSIDADFGFNLHDQSTYYTAGVTGNPATISFLAPAYNYEKSMNTVRSNATKVIVEMNEVLQHFIPGKAGRYNDTFEPRAFGDNIQKWGTSTILVESGGYPNDPEKQYIRKINYTLLLTALHSIATKNYEQHDLAQYDQIPWNERYLYDFIIRKATLVKAGKPYLLDMGINRYQVDFNQHRDYHYSSSITELGDLSVYHGYQELDAEGMTIVPGKVYPKKIKNFKKAAALNINALLKQGYTTIRIKKSDNSEALRKVFPLDVVGKKQNPTYDISLGSRPNFILQKDGKAAYAVVNGVLYDLNNEN